MKRLTDAQRDMVAAHIDVAEWAGRKSKTRLETDDAIQEAAIGMIEAVHEYRSGRGATYETFAKRKARFAIRDAIHQTAVIHASYKTVVRDMKSGQRGGRAEFDFSGMQDHREPSVPNEAARREWHEQFYLAVSLLKPRAQTIVKLKVDGLTLVEIGECIGLSRAMVHVSLVESLRQITAAMPRHHFRDAV